MATAEKSFREVKKMVEVDVHEDVITMTLSREEAETLRFLFEKIGGSPTNSPRRHIDAMKIALSGAGAIRSELAIQSGRFDAIYFKDYPKSEKPADESPLKVGDRVRVTSSRCRGDVGVLRRIDADDPDLTYMVYVDTYADTRWVHSVERVSE
ncbi:hypothetical protein [Kitasatospora mediocidica]|uniref:hypothetical protein n=1 Tax=Kitasatospora mediocidica TaxID=58352 RepID=UPI00056310FB|nr:hypothetical protein [Kitasatospora mediocidica]